MSFRLSGVMKHLVPPQKMDGEVIDKLTKEVKTTVVESGLEETVNGAINQNISKFNLIGKNLLPNPDFKFGSDMSMGDNMKLRNGVVTYGWETESNTDIKFVTGDVMPKMRYGYSFGQKDILKDGSCKIHLPLNGSVGDVGNDFEVVKSKNLKYGSGLFGKCVNFENKQHSEYVGIKNIPIETKMTFTFWVYIYDYNSDMSNLLSLATKDQDNFLILRTDSIGRPDIYINNNYIGKFGSEKIKSRKWTFVGLIIDNDRAYLYIDKNKYSIKIPKINTKYNKKDNALVFGQEQDKVLGGFEKTQALRGQISNFRMFTKALTFNDFAKVYVEDFNVEFRPHIACMTLSNNDKIIPFKTKVKNSLFKSVGDKLLLAFDFTASRTGTYCASIYSKDTNKTYNVEFHQDKNDGIKRHTLVIDTTEFGAIPYNDNENIEVIIMGYDKNNLGHNGINDSRKIGTNKCVEIKQYDIFTVSKLVMQPGTKEQPVLDMEDPNIIVDTPFGGMTKAGEHSRFTDRCAVQGPISWNKDYKVNWMWLLDFDNKSMRAEIGGIRILEDGYYEFEAAQRGNGNAPKNVPYIGIGLDGDRDALEDRNGVLSKNFWSHDHTSTREGWTKSKFYGFLKKGMLITAGTHSGNKGNVEFGSKGYCGFLIGRRIK